MFEPKMEKSGNQNSKQINERSKKEFLTGIILYKRKGGIKAYKAL